MADNETIADIIAEMRDEAARADMEQGYSLDDAAEMMREFAWRIDAAHKHERGDCAKLREAVGYILKYADSVACRDHDEHTRHYIDQIRKWAQSALSAPPRNCDLPEVAKDPWRAWLDDKSNWDEFGSPKLEIHDWLLAPATEKEGGAK